MVVGDGNKYTITGTDSVTKGRFVFDKSVMSWIFTQGDLTYTVLTAEAGNNIVSVKANSSNPPSGAITIPSTVTNNDTEREYSVTSIG